MDDSLKALERRLQEARAERARCEAADAHGDAYLTAHHYVRVLEQRLAHWPRPESLG
jgi:hypothetical protein